MGAPESSLDDLLVALAAARGTEMGPARELLERVSAGERLGDRGAALIEIGLTTGSTPRTKQIIAALVIHALREDDRELLADVLRRGFFAYGLKQCLVSVLRVELEPWPLFEGLLALELLSPAELEGHICKQLVSTPDALLPCVERLAELPGCEAASLRLARKCTVPAHWPAVHARAIAVFERGKPDDELATEAATLLIYLHQQGVDSAPHLSLLQAALSELGPRARRALASVLEPLCPLLHDHPDLEVRWGAFAGVWWRVEAGRVHELPAAVEQLVRGLASSDARIRDLVASCIFDAKEVLGDSPPSDECLELLARSGHEQALRFLEHHLHASAGDDRRTRELVAAALAPTGLSGALRERLETTPVPPLRCEICAALGRRQSWHEFGADPEPAHQFTRLEPPVPLSGIPAGDKQSSRCPECGRWYALRCEEDHRGFEVERHYTLTRLSPKRALARLRGADKRRCQAELPALLERARRECLYPEADTRREAAAWLAEALREDEDWEAYRELLTHLREEVRVEALRALPDPWPASLHEAIEAGLEGSLPKLRERAARALAKLGEAPRVDALLVREDPAITKGLVEQLDAPALRRHAVQLARSMAHEGLVSPCQRQLATLGADAPAQLRPVLAELLVHPELRARRGSAKLLAALLRKGWEAPELLEPLMPLLDARETEAAALPALAAYARRGRDLSAALPALARILAGHRAHAEVFAVLQPLIEQGSGTALQLAARELLGRWSSNAATRVIAIARARSVQSAVDTLREVLREGDSIARDHAARALLREGLRSDDTELLLELLTAAHDPTRVSALAELASAGTPPPTRLLAALVPLLEHEESWVMRYAVEVLARARDDRRGTLRSLLAAAPASRGRVQLETKLRAQAQG